MSNLLTDPFGFQLMKCNKPKKEEAPAPEKPKTPETQCYYYPSTSAYVVPQPCYQVYSPPISFVQQQYIVYQQYPHMYYVQASKEVAQDPPAAHQCVSCTEKNKCKDCKKEEEKNKKYVVKKNFWNPRSN